MTQKILVEHAFYVKFGGSCTHMSTVPTKTLHENCYYCMVLATRTFENRRGEMKTQCFCDQHS